MNDILTDFVDQLNVFPTLKDFNASSTSEALKWKDLVQGTMYYAYCGVLLIHNMGNRLFYLSRKLMGPVVMLGHVVC